MVAKSLLYILEHRPSVLLDKGEYTKGYYNPGNYFDQVHLLFLNLDNPGVQQLQFTVGHARLSIHNLPVPKVLESLGWQFSRLKPWIEKGIQIAEEVTPSLIRVHNNFLGGYLAEQIKRQLSIPYVVSVHHQHWEKDKDSRPITKLAKIFRSKFERSSIQQADGIIAIHEPMLDYVQRLGGKNVRLIYNVVSKDIPIKESFHLSSPPRLVTINQQIRYKNPENILKAVRSIDCHYVIIGDGPYHDRLERLANQENLLNKVKFVRTTPNQMLMKSLSSYDLMVLHCDYWGIPKSVLEAGLASMPIVINRHPQRPIPEYEGGWLVQCENTPLGYEIAIKSLLADLNLRASYGRRAYAYSQESFNPVAMESRIIDLYQSIIRKN